MKSNDSLVRDYYSKRAERFRLDCSRLTSLIRRSSVYRLSVFVAILAAAYLFQESPVPLVISLVAGTILFIALVVRHEKLKKELLFSKELLGLNEKELRVLKRDYDHLETGDRFQDLHHAYAHDIDLFGKGSLFQYLNRCGTGPGSELLANWLKSNDTQDIPSRQEALKELGAIPDWRQEFTARANLIPTEHQEKEIRHWIESYRSFLPDRIKFLPAAFSAISLILFVLVVFNLASFFYLLLWFFAGLGISAIHLKKINRLYESASKAKLTFRQYQNLLERIEKSTFSSELLSAQQKRITSEGKTASELFNEFSKALDALDQRNNDIVAILGNGLVLWDLKQSYKIEAWIAANRTLVAECFETIAHFDASNSLGNYVFNHADNTFPELFEKQEIIRAKKLGHPLIDPVIRVDNDLTLNKGDFTIVTGANMAGKSTFLRTVSLGIVMANLGLPVCAQEFLYSPVKLITSMRTVDNLSEESSYFHAEINRLHYIVNEVLAGNYFIVLDEILKGTNSLDKAEGSKKFLKKLIESGYSGMIATHDLSLCEIESEYPQIRNRHFDVEIINEELQFDFLLKDGICKNMNASFLLKKMKLI